MVDTFTEGRRERRPEFGLSRVTIVIIALKCDGIATTGLPIHAKSAMSKSPVVDGLAGGGQSVVVFEELAIHAPRCVFRLPSNPRRAKRTLRTGSSLDEDRPCFTRVFGDDVNDSIDSIGTPNAGPWASNDLDSIDVFHQDILNVPKHTAKERGVYRPSVDLDQQFVGESLVESTDRNGPFVRINAGNLHAGHQTQRFREISRSAAAYVFVCEDVNRGRGPPDRTVVPRYRCYCFVKGRDNDIRAPELFQIRIQQRVQIGKIGIGLQFIGLGPVFLKVNRCHLRLCRRVGYPVAK